LSQVEFTNCTLHNIINISLLTPLYKPSSISASSIYPIITNLSDK
jgi:hypothetical protein